MDISFILDKAVSLYDNAEAIVSGNDRHSYGQFADRVYRFSDALKKTGIGKGDRVGILHRNSHEYLETYFAVARLGAILVPLNIRLSSRELSFILEDAGVKTLVSERMYYPSIEQLTSFQTENSAVIWTGKENVPLMSGSADYEDMIANSEGKRIYARVNEEDIAHLYYTSGTTGRPKGVMLSHKNVCFHTLTAIAELKLNDNDTWIHAAPLFHLADAWATFAMTWVGGKHVIVPEFNPEEVLSLIETEKVTITNMIPTMLNMLVNTPGVNSRDFSSLRTVLSGGAPIAPGTVKEIIETFKCEYIQTYGMTEACPYLTLSLIKRTLHELPEEEKFNYRAKTGRPFMGIQLKVIREDGSEVEKDNREVGEIIVKGDSVTKGYWNRMEETENNIKNGWLYTGDLAVIDADEYVNIVDRKKDMIITGGENVYSIEVENILYSHPSILEVAVIGVPDPKWGEAVKAVVVLKKGEVVTEDEIIEYCREYIAGYKTPKSIEFVSELPRTGSGKIFKRGLKDRYSA
ncbi:long-chain-fatty-acid--CoA ligase [Thermodesulfobacteriota bacterium]